MFLLAGISLRADGVVRWSSQKKKKCLMEKAKTKKKKKKLRAIVIYSSHRLLRRLWEPRNNKSMPNSWVNIYAPCLTSAHDVTLFSPYSLWSACCFRWNCDGGGATSRESAPVASMCFWWNVHTQGWTTQCERTHTHWRRRLFARAHKVVRFRRMRSEGTVGDEAAGAAVY